MNSADQYDESYFLRGVETGKSLYTDYRWMPDLTIPMVRKIVQYCDIRSSDTVLDFGCARGYIVRAFRELGYNACGYDISEWAVDNCDPEVCGYVSTLREGVFCRRYDWIIAKDVLEHVPYVATVIRELMEVAVRGIFAVVPLSLFEGMPYVIDDYEKDITHIQRHTLATWVNYFLRPGWRVDASYRVRGIKDNWWCPAWEKGNGFLCCRRVME